MSNTRQALDFNLIRSGQFTYKELGVLEYINSYSSYCAPPAMHIMAKNLHMCVRTLRNILNTLVQKGIIIRKYMAFKKLKLAIVSLAIQKTLKGPGMIIGALCKQAKLRKKHSHRQNGAHPYGQIGTHSIQNKTLLKNKTTNTDDFFKELPKKNAFEQIASLISWDANGRPALI